MQDQAGMLLAISDLSTADDEPHLHFSVGLQSV
jgi:hypothetical protein